MPRGTLAEVGPSTQMGSVPERFVRSPSVLWRKVPGRVLVLTGDEEHELLGPAADVWLMLEQSCTMDEVSDALSRRFEVAESTLKSDLAGLFSKLVSLGLLRVVQ